MSLKLKNIVGNGNPNVSPFTPSPQKKQQTQDQNKTKNKEVTSFIDLQQIDQQIPISEQKEQDKEKLNQQKQQAAMLISEEEQIYKSVLCFLNSIQSKPQCHFLENQIPYLLDVQKQWNYVEGRSIDGYFDGKATFFDKEHNILDKVQFEEGYVHQFDIN